MKLRIILSALAIIIATMTSEAQNITAEKGKVKNSYNFWKYTPAGAATDSVGKPLIVFLHGASLCGRNMERVKRYGTIDAISKGRSLDAYVIAPQNPGGAWSPRKVIGLVDYMIKNNNIDTTRIYVMGMSLGGYGTLDVAAAYPDRFAAAIGICGGATGDNLAGLAKMPLWIIHGTADRAVTVQQSDRVVKAVEAARQPGDTVQRLVYDRVKGMNHGRPARLLYSSEVYDWLLGHRLNEAGRPIHPTPEINDNMLRHCYDGLKMPSRRSRRRR